MRYRRSRGNAVLKVMRVARWLDYRHVPVLPRTLRTLVWGKWLCSVAGHAVVPALPWCFRCDHTWDTWEDVPRKRWQQP